MKMIAILLSLLSVCTAHAAEKPNIVIIYADDMGYGDCTANNPESKIPTPHIDRLAAEGMRFTDAHSPATVCTPSRYGLLTGINPAREGIVNPLLKFGKPTHQGKHAYNRRAPERAWVRHQDGGEVAFGLGHGHVQRQSGV